MSNRNLNISSLNKILGGNFLLGRKAGFLDARPPVEQLDSPSTKMDKEGLRRARLELLASMLWAQMKDPEAIVKETAPNELTIQLKDLSWVLTVSDEGKIAISGFDSGVEQYIGKMPDNDTEISIVEIASNAMELIQEDIEENQEPPADPIHFGPEDEQESSEVNLDGEIPSEDPAPPNPEMAQGDELMDPAGGMSPDGSMSDPSMGMPPAAPPMGMPPAAPPMGMPPAAPPSMMGAPPQQPPMFPGMPQASRKHTNREQMTQSVRTASKRMAVIQLEEAANQLEELSKMAGEKEDGIFRTLAYRIDRVTNTLEQ